MAIKVSTSSKAIKVSIPSTNTRLTTTVASGSKIVSGARIEQLANVDTTTNWLEDGYTIVYDEDTGKWVSQQLSAAVQVDNLDGGTY
jgi:hypothetical protein